MLTWVRLAHQVGSSCDCQLLLLYAETPKSIRMFVPLMNGIQWNRAEIIAALLAKPQTYKQFPFRNAVNTLTSEIWTDVCLCVCQYSTRIKPRTDQPGQIAVLLRAL